MSAFPRLEEFFRAAWGLDPFPWQRRVAERIEAGRWPDGIRLPTASGKTACIDLAVWALAAQAERSLTERTAPRRIALVIDRRVVVDEAWERSLKLARLLLEAKGGPLAEIARRLRAYTGGEGEPLTVHRLRGGTLRDDSWMRRPDQPAVLLSTVDQVGSRLLFRGYGVSARMAPVHAGLLGNDTLLILDEAHCAEPFMQTARTVARLRRAGAEPLPGPFQVVVMSATLPPGTSDAVVAGKDDLADPVLGRRLKAGKPARLFIAKEAKGEHAEERLAATLATEAEGLLRKGHRAVAVMVNRVKTAQRVHVALAGGKGRDVVLLIGRMRPLDRDALLERWRPVLAAVSGAQKGLERPVIVVATQTLEVGANLDFSGLVTECAPLDSLRQRFGRLNRLGETPDSEGVVVVRADQAKKSDDDPVYGAALAASWNWLVEQGGKKGVVDFGVEALDTRLRSLDEQQLRGLRAPTSDAPTLLPAHLDLLVQTSPLPEPDADVSLFLHGVERSSAEVQVVWRADLDPERPALWPAIVGLCPPNGGECLSTPLWLARSWLRGDDDPGPLSDLEGEAPPGGEPAAEGVRRAAVVWRGRDDCTLIDDGAQLRAGDTLLLPVTAGGFDRFGHVPDDRPLDLAEEAFQAAQDRVLLRVHPAVLAPWKKLGPVAELLELAGGSADELEPAVLREVLRRLEKAEVPAWLRRAAELLVREARRLVAVPHPGGGLVLAGRGRLGLVGAEPSEEREGNPGPVGLARHLNGVGAAASTLGRNCGLVDSLVSYLAAAGSDHDLGKADPRFQRLLATGNAIPGELLAKSSRLSLSPVARAELAARCGLPKGWRHETLSTQMLGDSAGELVSHLVASHHGFARPLPPTTSDPGAEQVIVEIAGRRYEGKANLSPEKAWEIAERFWALNRRHGWWGLAWLEAILRLADHRRSESEARETSEESHP